MQVHVQPGARKCFRLARVFDPSFVSENEAFMKFIFAGDLASIKPLARDDGALITALQRDSHLYISAARGFTLDHSDVDVFTEAVLAWWKNHGASTGACREAAEICFFHNTIPSFCRASLLSSQVHVRRHARKLPR